MSARTSARCAVCGTAQGLTKQIYPGLSGPGGSRFVCELDAMLPADPDSLVESVTKVLMRKAGRG